MPRRRSAVGRSGSFVTSRISILFTFTNSWISFLFSCYLCRILSGIRQMGPLGSGPWWVVAGCPQDRSERADTLGHNQPPAGRPLAQNPKLKFKIGQKSEVRRRGSWHCWLPTIIQVKVVEVKQCKLVE